MRFNLGRNVGATVPSEAFSADISLFLPLASKQCSLGEITISFEGMYTG